MFNLIIGGLGAIIGSFIGVGPLWGFAIGAALGSIGELVFAGSDTTVTKGPRISDLQVQTSNYGADIPDVFGTVRLAGNVIWATELEERRKIRHLDGDAEYWEYYYYAYFAVGLCEGEIVGVRRIWLDNKLWLDLSSTLDFGGSLTQSIQTGERYAIYNGSETQTQDPIIASYLGTANTPAYRGLAYIRFNRLNVQNYGNRIPQVHCEVVKSGTAETTEWEVDLGYTPQGVTMTNDLNLVVACNDDDLIRVHDGISSTVLTSFQGPHSGTGAAITGLAIWNGDLYTLWQTTGPSQAHLTRHVGISGAISWTRDLFSGLTGDIVINGVYMWMGNRSGNEIVVYPINPVVEIFRLNGLGSASSGQNLYGLTLDDDLNLLEHNWNDQTLYQRSGRFGGQQDVITSFPRCEGIHYERNYNLLIAAQNDGYIRVYDGYSKTLKQTGQLSITDKAVSEIVSKLSTSTDLTASDIDVTDLAGDTTEGYIRTGVMSARKAIEPLAAGFQFNPAEIDHKIHFVKRGGANQATITADELAAHEYGSEMPDKINYTRTQEVEAVPREFNLTFIDKNRDYQEGHGRSIRMSLNNKNKSKIELPIVMTATEGKQLAEIMHNTAVTEQVKVGFNTYLKYLYLAPTNVITVDGYKMRIEQMSIRNNLLAIEGPAELDANYTSNASTTDPDFDDQDLSSGGPTNYQMIDMPILSDYHDDAGFYIAVFGVSSNWAGASVYVESGGAYIESLAILDATIIGSATNALADADPSVWDYDSSVTIRLSKSTDSLSDKTEAEVLSGQNWAVIGTHGNWEVIAFQNVTDNGDGTWTLDTFLRGLKGSEYKTGSHAANDIFVMLDLNITALDDGNLGRYRMASGFIDVSQNYKVISLHEDSQAYSGIAFTNSAVGLKPYAPTDIEGSRDGSNNLTITWNRSSRIDNGWDDYREVQLGEDSEAYEVDILGNEETYRWDPDLVGTDLVLSNSNRTCSTEDTGTNRSVISKWTKSTGKWYMEFTTLGNYDDTDNTRIGICDKSDTSDFDQDVRVGNNESWSFGGNGYIRHDGSSEGRLYTGTMGNCTWMLAIDCDAGKVWFGKNGSWHNSGDPANALNPAIGPAGTGAFYSDSSLTNLEIGACWTTTQDSVVPESVTSNFRNSELVYDPPSGFTAIDGGLSVLRTIEATSETASYTAVQQTADGLTPGEQVAVKVYQISETVGRGYEEEATI